MGEITLSSLNGWDWFIVIVFAGSVLLGLLRGLVRTVFGLAAWVIALLGTPLAAPAAVQVSAMQQQPWVVFVLLFIALFVVVRVTGALLARAIGKLGLGGADRGLGALLGGVRALALIALVVVVARSFDLNKGAAWRTALSRPLLDAIVFWVEPYLPSRVSGLRQT
jgi:membrane protein required for colicin V production